MSELSEQLPRRNEINRNGDQVVLMAGMEGRPLPLVSGQLDTFSATSRIGGGSAANSALVTLQKCHNRAQSRRESFPKDVSHIITKDSSSSSRVCALYRHISPLYSHV